MTENPGVAPLDPLSLVGQCRLMVGDTDYVPLATPVAGMASYAYFSDNAITAFLTAGRQSVSRAVGNAYLQLAAGAALTASAVKTDDLSLSTVSRAGDLLKVAQGWFDRADDEDLVANDIFEVVQTGARRSAFADPFSVHTSNPRQDPSNPGYFLV